MYRNHLYYANLNYKLLKFVLLCDFDSARLGIFCIMSNICVLLYLYGFTTVLAMVLFAAIAGIV